MELDDHRSSVAECGQARGRPVAAVDIPLQGDTLPCRSKDRRGILQVVGRRVRIVLGEPWGDQPPRTQVVCIGAPGGVDEEHLRREFEKTVSGNAESITQIVHAIAEWRRA